MKPLVIYHDNCADGFGAAFCAWLKLGDEAEYLPCQYGDKANAFDTIQCADRDVYILDFSFPKMIMDSIFALASHVVWCDHHKTAFGMWLENEGWDQDFSAHEYLTDPQKSFHTDEPHAHVTLNNWKSGAMIAWEYFHPHTPVPLLIQHIDDYDRWQFKMDGTKEFNKALWSYAPWSFEQWNKMAIWMPEVAQKMREEGAALLRNHEQNVQSVVKNSARVCKIVPVLINSVDSYKAPWVWWTDEINGDTCGANGLVANCPPFLTSDVGHALATQSGTFGLCWTLSQEGMIAKCSLRSNGDYDVSAIAKAFGGGGHRNAAGFAVPLSTLLEWMR